MEELCAGCGEVDISADGIICLECGGTFCEQCIHDHDHPGDDEDED